MVEIISDSGSSRDQLEELDVLYEEGLKFLQSRIPLQMNWEVNWIDKVMSRLQPKEIIEFLGNKPNPHHKGPPVSPPEVIKEYLERLEIIINSLKNS